MERKTKYLLIWALASTVVAVLMTINTIKLIEADGIVEYVKAEKISCPTLGEQLEERAHEIREDNKDMDLERYRLDAIREVNQDLQTEANVSPFVDYEAMELEYGY